ncbi:MAG: invasion associated locus B family protein [Paracoccus sp. (in: a-proteobacteria)]|nr:invasion associated locus B family protein [Paracoccus sp. (in: a-proteobacteria)]
MAHKTISAALAAAILAGLPAVSLAQVASPLTGETAQAVSDAATEAASNAEAAAQTASEAAAEAAAATGEAVEAAAGAAADAAEDAAQAAEAAADAATDAAAAATEAPAEPPAETPAETPAATAETTEPPVGAYYVRETFTDWTLRCIRTPDGNDPCELYQLLQDSDGTSVAEMTLIPLEGGGQAVTGASVVAPLETDLQFGVGYQIDSGDAKRYPFSFCAPVGCVARMGFTNAELNSMKRGLLGHVVLLPFGAPESEAFDLELSLAGFTAGYTALEEVVAELRAAAEADAGATQ